MYLGENIAHLRNSYTNSPSYPEVVHISVTISGIINNDLLQNFSVFEFVTVGEEKILRLSNGLIPLGHLNFNCFALNIVIAMTLFIF